MPNRMDCANGGERERGGMFAPDTGKRRGILGRIMAGRIGRILAELAVFELNSLDSGEFAGRTALNDGDKCCRRMR